MSHNYRTGILLINLGTPDSPEVSDVRKYLIEFLLDKRVIDIPWFRRQLLVRGIIAPFRAKASSKLYKQLWTAQGSPLKYYGVSLKDKLQHSLGNEYVVELGMRYQSPSIESAVDALIRAKVSKIIVFPLYPQYASASTGSSHEEVMRILSLRQSIPDVHFIHSYPDDPRMIDVYVKHAKTYDLSVYDHIIISFHGIPQRHIYKADDNNHCRCNPVCCAELTDENQFCYSAQSYATARAIAGSLQLDKDDYTVSFQSRLGRNPWVEPYTSDVIEALARAGKKKVLVFCPAFAADCLETIIEIGVEYNELFRHAGGDSLDLVPSLNDDPDWVNTVAEMVTRYK